MWVVLLTPLKTCFENRIQTKGYLSHKHVCTKKNITTTKIKGTNVKSQQNQQLKCIIIQLDPQKIIKIGKKNRNFHFKNTCVTTLKWNPEETCRNLSFEFGINKLIFKHFSNAFFQKFTQKIAEFSKKQDLRHHS